MASLGSFSNGGLGFGLAFVLEDYFTDTSKTINKSLDNLADHTEVITGKINKALSLISTGAVLIGAGALISAPFVAGVSAASDLEENLNKVDVIFGKYAQDVKDFGDNALENYGIDKIMALDMAGLFGDMSTSMGFNQEQAAGMSKKLVALAGDISSLKDVDHEVAKTALAGVFTGETESLKKLGAVMTEASLASYALSHGISKQIKDMSQAEKVQLRLNFVTDAFKNSIGDYARTADSYANAKRGFVGAIKEMSANLGGVLMPMFAKTFSKFTGLIKKINEFSKTNAGKTIMLIVAALGIFLVVAGLSMVLIGGMRLGIIKMANAFGASTKAKILDTIATEGLTAGLYEMGVAAWASLGPYILIAAAIAAFAYVAYEAWDMVTNGTESMAEMGAVLFWLLGPIGWIIGAVAGISRGFSELDKDADKMATGGILGFFTKVAGVIEAVSQIWNSWTGETFTLTDELANKLDKLGILPFVLELGKVVVRVKQFFMGLGEGLAPIKDIFFEFVGFLKDKFLSIIHKLIDAGAKLWNTFKEAFAPIANLFKILSDKLFGSSQSLTTWKTIGQAVGTAISIAFQLVIGVLEGIIDIIVWVVTSFISLWTGIIQGVMWLVSAIAQAFAWVGETIWGFFQWVVSLPLMMIDVGVQFVTYLLEGIQSMWTMLTDWISEKITTLVDSIVKPLQAAWDWVAGNDPNGDGTTSPVSAGGGGSPIAPVGPIGGGMHPKVTSKNPNLGNAFSGGGNGMNGGTGQPIILQNIMDGEVISEKMMNKQELKTARRD